ncbi:MAG: UvrD-helicase domain-containing protein, partial [Candidatus Cloacimonetes bacterium]|nr:UvrD-helicase domain-containing protein [Candidatus Cloacimonadota bacterium]
MRNMVISASAGSGKTYRLAVEYISLIVKNLGFADFHFERILVITFTKKATAEIRSQIFAMFDLIFCEDPNLQPQRTALLKILEEKTGIAFTDDLFATLQRQIISIKTQKDKVRISTIDSLINQVFKAMIAPIMKIAFYTIEENANYDIWMEIFPELVKDKNIAILKKIFEYDTEKILSNLTDAFEVLVENRWVLHWMKAGNHTLKSDDGKEFLSPEMIEKAKTEAHTEYCKQFRAYTGLLKATILEKMAVSENDPLFSDYFTKGPMAILAKSGTLTAENFDILIEEFLQKGIFSLPKSALKLLVDNEAKIHNGTRIRKIDTSRLKSALVLFAYYHYYAEEQLQLIKLWEVLLQKYDDLKQSSGKLSYSDITWFTYSHLYAPEHSMIDPQSFAVENQFYEFLAVRNQYLLIDEFQDTSFMQFMILAPMMTDLIAGNSVHSDTAVIVVGDEKQSIYGWRGGEKALLNYMQTFLGTAIESMTHCYRSAPLLVNYVNLLFGTEERPQNGIPNNAWQFTGDIISARTDEKGAVNCKFI